MHPRIDALQKAAVASDVIGLAGGLPATELMPRDEIQRALADVAKNDDALQYGWPEGIAELREWIAGRLNARGANIEASRVIVTAGAQQALTLIAMAHRGSQIAIGEASYPAALAAFRREWRRRRDAPRQPDEIDRRRNGHDRRRPRHRQQEPDQPARRDRHDADHAHDDAGEIAAHPPRPECRPRRGEAQRRRTGTAGKRDTGQQKSR